MKLKLRNIFVFICTGGYVNISNNFEGLPRSKEESLKCGNTVPHLSRCSTSNSSIPRHMNVSRGDFQRLPSYIPLFS